LKKQEKYFVMCNSSKELKITIIQSDLIWEDKKANYLLFDKKIDAITEQTDLIVLPEMFNTGFSMHPKPFSESMEGETIQWMKEKAASKNAVITGSLMITEDDNYYNRLVWMKPDGSFFTYDKRHLFRLSDEGKYFDEGGQRNIITINDWSINLQICYDLRFPVWSRNVDFEGTANGKSFVYDVLLYVANWPTKRSTAWKTLLKARAIENQAFVIGVNRVGEDGNGISHSGDSKVIDYLGDDMVSASPNQEETITVTLSKEKLFTFRNKFPFNLDADDYQVNS